MRTHRLTAAGVAALFVLSLLGWPAGSGALAAAATMFSGQATVVSGKIAGMPITLIDTGPVDAGGGHLEKSLLTYPDSLPNATGDALKAEVLHATVIAHGNKSSAEAVVASFSLAAANQTISAEFLAARASATCNSGTATISGSSEVVGLMINGAPVTVGTEPETISIPFGSVAINEQPVASASGNGGAVTVNALHIVLGDPLGGTNTTDLVIASAHADITCAAQAGRCADGQDFVTGGGWITTKTGSRANFAVAGGPNFWGHLLYIDHSSTSGVRAKGTAVTGYVSMGPTTREIDGKADASGAATSGPYTVLVTDGGEPGRGVDFFQITLPNYAQPTVTLDGGNIQLHCK